MAWRVDEQVIRGEIDCRTRGRVSGKIWFLGWENPLTLELEGAPWRDLAGHVLRFTNPDPKPADISGLTEIQQGAAGDITASRKVKVPECTMDELMEFYKARQPFPWHWGNSLYLEWFSRTNGRVVIESASFTLELEATATWQMSEADEVTQREANAAAMMGFMENLGMGEAIDDDEAPSEAEREAVAEDARMNLLLDRVTARLEREGRAEDNFERILAEARERLNRENNVEPEEPTPEQAAERAAWIEEMNTAAREALEDMETESWKDGGDSEKPHPLVERASDLAIRLHREVDAAAWLPADASAEHPLAEIIGGVMSASAKLAGALGMHLGDEAWPPDPLIAGNVIVRLRKAHDYLGDARRALDSADAENLADAPWRAVTRRELEEISAQVTALIREAREVLEDPE